MTQVMDDLQVNMFGYPKWYNKGITKDPFKIGDIVNIMALDGVSADKETVEMLRKTWTVSSCTPAYVLTPLWDVELEGNPYRFTSDDIEKV